MILQNFYKFAAFSLILFFVLPFPAQTAKAKFRPPAKAYKWADKLMKK